MAATVCWSTQVTQTRSLKGAVLQGWLGFFFSLLCSSERWDASCMWWLETVMSLIVSLHRKGWNSPLAARKGVGVNFQFQSVLWSLLYLRWYLFIQSFGLTWYTATVKLCSDLNGVDVCRYFRCGVFFGGGGHWWWKRLCRNKLIFSMSCCKSFSAKGDLFVSRT